MTRLRVSDESPPDPGDDDREGLTKAIAPAMTKPGHKHGPRKLPHRLPQSRIDASSKAFADRIPVMLEEITAVLTE